MLGWKVIAAAVLAAAALTGCGTVSGLRGEPVADGVHRAYYADYGEVTQAAAASVRSIGLTVEEIGQLDRDTWYVIATAGASAFSWGELVRVAVQRHAATPNDVWVLTKRRLATNITAKDDYSPDVYQRMDAALGWQRRPPPAAPAASAPDAVARPPSP